jgi:hypothetical protein
MKRVSAIAMAVAAALLISIFVEAQPITGGGGLSKVSHTGAFYGSGTAGNPLDLRHDCGAGSGLVYSGSAWTCGASGGSGGGGSAVTPSLAMTAAATTGTPNLTTLGTSDWVIPQTYTATTATAKYASKLAGGYQIEADVRWALNGSITNIQDYARTQTVTWTSTDNITGSSAGAGWATARLAYSAAAVGYGFVTSAPSSTVTRTFTIYVANYAETDGVTCTANLADNEVAAAAQTFTMTGTSSETVTVTYRSAQATRVNVACLISTNPAGTNLGWLAMWLA